MGLCAAKPGIEDGATIDEAEVRKLEAADRELKAKAAKKATELGKIRKVLLLGPGEAGKSTFLKQMLRVHKGGFSEDRRRDFVDEIRSNLINHTHELVKYCQSDLYAMRLSKLEEKEPDPLSAEGKETSQLLEKCVDEADSKPWEMLSGALGGSAKAAAALKALWLEPALQVAWKLRSTVQVPESYSYFINKATDIAKDSYLPTEEDLIFSRARTTGIVTETFEMKEGKFTLVDVGGQKNERKKWITQFDDVSCILFLCAISEYDQFVWENDSLNRMHDAIQVFKDISNNPVFAEVPMVVFFNKNDLFLKKFESVSLSTCFSDWDKSKDKDINAAYTFIEKKFRDVTRKSEEQILFVPTSAIDPDNVKKVWTSVELLILNGNLSVFSGF